MALASVSLQPPQQYRQPGNKHAKPEFVGDIQTQILALCVTVDKTLTMRKGTQGLNQKGRGGSFGGVII